MPAPKKLGVALAAAGAMTAGFTGQAEKVGQVGTLKKQRVTKGAGQKQQAQLVAKNAVEGQKRRAQQGQDLAKAFAQRGGIQTGTAAAQTQQTSIAATQAAATASMAASISALANIAADRQAASAGVPVGNAKGQGGIVALARSQLGVPYVWAEANPKGKAGGQGSGFDCSGLTMWLYQRSYGVQLPHMASEQQKMLGKVSRQGLQVGDLVFFNYGRKSAGVADHVGLYIGNGMMIDASSSNGRMVQRAVDWDHFLHGGTLRKR